MEGGDVFAGGEIGQDEDPFAGTDFGDFGEPEAVPAPAEEPRPAPEAAATAEPPVVNREGERVETQPADKGALPTLTPEQQAAEAAAYRESHGEPEPAAAATPAPAPTPVVPEDGPGVREPEPEPEPEPAAEVTPPPTPAAGAIADAPPAETPQEPAGEPEAEESAPAATPEPEAAAQEPAEPEAKESPEPEVAEGDAAAPAEKKDKNGRTTHRRYLILKPEGNGKYSEVVWYENAKGEMVEKGSRGAKRQKYALARGQEDALRVGYAALGAPPKATIVAVAVSAFQPKTVEPEVPQPSAVRLKIR